MLLFVVLAWQIEEKYGAFRLAFIFFWSAIGGQSSTCVWCFKLSLSLCHTVAGGLQLVSSDSSFLHEVWLICQSAVSAAVCSALYLSGVTH